MNAWSTELSSSDDKKEIMFMVLDEIVPCVSYEAWNDFVASSRI
jgi:hypothetical protein